MKKEPCIRLGMRIRPKISENPADTRNNKPHIAMLFTARVSHKLIGDRRALEGFELSRHSGLVRPHYAPSPALPRKRGRGPTSPSRRCSGLDASLLFEVLG